jgi:hypothetical protein
MVIMILVVVVTLAGCDISSNSGGLNIVVEWLVLLLCIWEVPGSNLGPEIGYPD